MHVDLEYRNFDCRAEAEVNANELVLHGTAIVFEKWQRIASRGERATAGSGKTREKVVETAIRIGADGKPEVYRTYRSRPIKALVNHNETQYLANTDSGLKLIRTKQGLDFELRLPNTTRSRDLVELAKAEQKLPVSIGFMGRGSASKILSKKEVNVPSEGEEKLQLPAPELQPTDRPLSGSDWTEGRDPRTGRRWRVYHSLDLREISILEGLDPAWEGVQAEIGNAPSQRALARAWLDYTERVYV